ncbi:MAG TPA: hypothetical protein VGO00_07510, partial [Kofleriaceae bacterium]|nr:hypothetical protein [Kofleriaceae bacterium]
IILPAEGGIKAKVAFADGTAPAVVVATLGPIEQSFVGGNIMLDGIPPGDYSLSVRGVTFDSTGVDVTIQAGQTTDAGTITVAQGRHVAGLVTSNGAPVSGATVYAGRRVMGTGSSNSSPGLGLDQGTKSDTTGPDGSFSLAGFGDGDLTIVAELPAIGRSKAMLVSQDAPNQATLVLELQAYGSISGALHQDQSAAGIAVTVQSTTTPGAMYVVNAGSDGSYSFDRLAPDTYKVSATLGNPRRGVHFYSKQVDVAPSQHASVDLSVDAGNVTLQATPVPTNGTAGTSIAYLASTVIAATTARDLGLKLAAAGPGSSQTTLAREGGPATFTLVAAGPYSVCLVPLPAELQGGQAMSYMDRHSGSLLAYCQAVTVAPSPTTQATSVTITVPALIHDTGGKGSGSGG